MKCCYYVETESVKKQITELGTIYEIYLWTEKKLSELSSFAKILRLSGKIKVLVSIDDLFKLSAPAGIIADPDSNLLAKYFKHGEKLQSSYVGGLIEVGGHLFDPNVLLLPGLTEEKENIEQEFVSELVQNYDYVSSSKKKKITIDPLVVRYVDYDWTIISPKYGFYDVEGSDYRYRNLKDAAKVLISSDK